jgi:endonuclease G
MLKRKRATKLALAISLTAVATTIAAGPRLLAYQAKNHLGENATVCGVVVSTKYLDSKRRSPTLLDLDHPYPQQPFTIVIWGDDRPKFGTPEVGYKGKRVCVTGTISEFRGTPEIVAKDPSQITTE